MSDREHPPAAAENTGTIEPKAAETAEIPAESSPLPDPVSGWRTVAAGLGAALLLVVALVATAPLWAKLLPWGSVTSDEAERALASRLDRLEATQAQVPQLIQQQQEQLRRHVDQVQQAAAEAKTSLQRLVQRIDTIEARPQSPAAGDIAELRQQLAQMSRNASELAARVDAVEKGVREQTARDTTDAAMVMGLLQIRSAVQAGRPFTAEYEAFATLARRHPEIAEAAASLAEAAQTGVASPAVLAKRLRELAGGIAGAGGPVAASDPGSTGWGEAALARLRGLVTIRRVDGAKPSSAEAAVGGAELALAGGDLAGAIAALDKLTGAAAEAAAPWLRMARQRLTVDTALRRLEALVTARLGSPTTAPGSSG
jgi:hypothetical protein